MTQFSTAPERIIGRTAYDSSGDKIGKVGQIYLDDQSGEPVWITVSTGMFGTKESFAPLGGATEDGDKVMLAVDKQQIKDAPNISDDGHLNDQEQDELYRYYGSGLGMTGGTGRNTADVTSRADLSTQSGTGTEHAMTRSEEQLHVGTERVETGRARLRKYVVTEDVTQTVPVSHEEVRLVNEPITDANRGEAMSGPEITEAEHEITLHADRPVVSKETVPVEQVRLETETVTSQESVGDSVRKEQVELQDESTSTGGRDR